MHEQQATDGVQRNAKAIELATIAAELVNASDKRSREEVAKRIGAMLGQAIEPEKVPAEYPLTFTTARNTYALSRQAKADDVESHMSARLSQLSALLSMAYGAGFESFTNYNETIQENYLWACSSLADECGELFTALGELQRAERAEPAAGT